MTQRPFYFIFALTIFLFEKAYSQTTDLSFEEDKLIKLYAKVLSSSETGNDSTIYYSEQFATSIRSLVKNNPATLSYNFKALGDKIYFNVKTSADGNFRIYSWDTQTGGTMHFFNQIYQYRADGKVFTEILNYEEGVAGSFCSKIHSVVINGKTYYLPISNAILSTTDMFQSISAFAIRNNKLDDTVKIFKTKKESLNSIHVEFDFFSVVDRPERPVELIVYDDKLKIIYIPVVNDEGKVSSRNLLYQLKKDCFEFIGVETDKRN